eukprot:6483246-Amphidinium_carterae.1
MVVWLVECSFEDLYPAILCKADVVFPEPTPDHVFKANSTATTTHHPSTRSIRCSHLRMRVSSILCRCSRQEEQKEM